MPEGQVKSRVLDDAGPGGPKLEACEERSSGLASGDLRTALVLSGVLAALSFLIHLAIAWRFERLGLYFYNDVLFGSDAHDFLASISHGERSVRVLTPDLQNSVHPYVWFYFSPFVRTLAKLAVLVDVTRMNVFDARLLIGIAVVPFCAGLQCFAFGMLLHFLGFRPTALVLVSCLGIVSFSSLIYASIPDHFALTNLVITLMMIAAILVVRGAWTDRLRLWFPLGCLAAGITITNVVFLGIIVFFTRLYGGARNVWSIAAGSFALAAGTFVFVLLTADAIGFFMHGPPETAVMHRDFVARYMRAEKEPVQGLERAAKGLSNAIAPAAQNIGKRPPPALPEEQYPITRPPLPHRSIYPAYTLETPPGIPLGNRILTGVALTGVVVGGIILFARGGMYRMIALTSAAILAFNLGFHNIWGDEFVLYSQHWMAAYLLLSAGLFLLPWPLRSLVAVGAVCFVVAVGWNNAILLRDLMAAMQETAATANLFVD